MQLWVRVAARDSRLSRAQVKEVEALLKNHHSVHFEPVFLKSMGDLDLKTPLVEKVDTDFFTRQIDEQLLSDSADIAIHSAKDLPSTLPLGLTIIALTKGQDPRDSFLSFKYTLDNLPLGSRIGVCSERRIEALKKIRSDLVPYLIRGPIDYRIAQMEQGVCEGLILAEAGLLRLGIPLPRTILDIPVAPFQGRLAIVAKESREDLKTLFRVLDAALCG